MDICNRSGPEVPIRITTSTNTSVTLHPSDNNKTKGDIAVWQLQCSHNRTSEQVYKVVVESTENYTVSAEILFSLLPQQCIVVYVSSKSFSFSHICHFSSIFTCLMRHIHNSK